MKYLKIQQEVLKNWFETRALAKAYIYRACHFDNNVYITDNKVIFIIPKDFFMLSYDEYLKQNPEHVKRVIKEPVDLVEYEKTNRIEIWESQKITLAVLENKCSRQTSNLHQQEISGYVRQGLFF